MSIVCSDRPLSEPFCKALNYANPRLVRAAAHELSISAESALELFHELKLFCYMVYSDGEPLSVPVRIDNFWHIFLDEAHKPQFDAFCMDCFAGTIEHIPNGKKSDERMSRTVDRAHEKFGSRLAVRWEGETRCFAKYRAAA